MNTPQYHQRSRKAGDRQPENCRYCGRGTKYGNATKVEKDGDAWVVDKDNDPEWYDMKEQANEIAVERYMKNMYTILSVIPEFYDDLLQYDYLSCFCDPSLPCHVKDAIIPHLQQRAKELEMNHAS